MEITRLFDLLDRAKQNFPNKPLFTYKEEGEWKKHYINEYIEKANNISYALMNLGVKKGDNIALISSGRPEWNYVDMGVQQIGAVLVPIYPTISEDDYLYILTNAGVEYLILETCDLLRKIKNILPQLTCIKEIYTINPCPTQSSLDDLIKIGEAHPAPEELQKIKSQIDTEEVATMIYTSGTTGIPKGVMITHRGILMNVLGIKESPGKYFTNALSFLPLCHIYERMMNYLYQYLGFETYYAENIAKVAEDALIAKPHIMAAVPRFLEKVYDKIYRKGEKLTGMKKKIFFWAVNLAFEYDLDHSKLSTCYLLKRKIADKLVYKTIRESLGGNLDMLVSGGASIQPRLVRFFSCVGLTLYEGYGLTECSPLVAVTNSKPGGRKIGTVGFPLDGCEVKILPDTNEVICRGGNVMKGYYKSPELTAEAIDSEGWFHTGDTGRFDEEGFLHLTGRTKSMFKTSMGKFVNPEVIEEKFKESPFILDMMVVGEGEKYAAAIIAPDFDFLHDWQKRHGVNCQTREEMVADKTTIARYQRVMEKYNVQLGATEQVKNFHLVTDTWTNENGMLTPTLKIKRSVVTNRYTAEIANLFK